MTMVRVQTYNELRQQIHDDLRFQHPEWVQPNGESPICDSYESRLMELLTCLERSELTACVPGQGKKASDEVVTCLPKL
jgi:hypothetical protein